MRRERYLLRSADQRLGKWYVLCKLKLAWGSFACLVVGKLAINTWFLLFPWENIVPTFSRGETRTDLFYLFSSQHLAMIFGTTALLGDELSWWSSKIWLGFLLAIQSTQYETVINWIFSLVHFIRHLLHRLYCRLKW